MRPYRPHIALALLLLAALAPTRVRAQADAVDEYVRAEMRKRQVPGLALAVIRDGEVVKLKGYGFANLEHDVPATPDTVFELASVTKQFTATAVMLLVEEGKINLDDPVGRYLDGTPEAWKGITVRRLLTHTAGLASLEEGFKALYEGGVRLNYTTAQMFEAAKKDPLSFAPGERWQYSDVGYFLLGMIVEKASGQGYRDFVSERFFKPLGMTSTSVLDQWAIIKHRAAGYTLRDGRLAQIRRVVQTELPSHYGIFSTVRDLAKWEAALAAGRVVKPSSLEQMWTPVRLNSGASYTYGFGWELGERRGHRMITHTGITGTEYTRFPDERLTVVVLTNLGVRIGATGVNSWGLTKGVAGRFVPGLLFTPLKERPDAEPVLTRELREFLGSLARGEDTRLMTPGLRHVLGPGTRANTARRLAALKSFTPLACEDVRAGALERNGARVGRRCYYKMLTGTDTIFYTFWLTPDGKVADLSSAVE